MPAGAALACARDVERRDGRFHALSAEPWLDVAPHPALRPGRFVEIVTRLGAWDEPVRPIVRFVGAAGVLGEAIGSGPVAGAAHWIGRVPAGTQRLEISPTCRCGPFDVEIESIRTRSLFGLLWQGLRQAPRPALSALLTRLVGFKAESDANLLWAIGFTPLAKWQRWREVRARPLDLEGLDRPRIDWTAGVRFRVVLVGADDMRARTSLAAQIYPRHRCDAVNGDGDVLPDVPARDFVVALAGGTALLRHALATIAETAARHPDAMLIYADEEGADAAGGVRPRYKPGWDAAAAAIHPHFGRATFVRGDLWGRFSAVERAVFIADGRLPPAQLARLAAGEVRAVPRILLTGAASYVIEHRPAAPMPNAATATIVIPTRDQPRRLARCLAALRTRANDTRFEIVIVDNGSVGRATKRLFQELARAPHISILARPGPFNFSALCNDAAATSAADVLVFLNDDTIVRTPDWLDRLMAQALRADVGAVGARLLYPDGRLQHAGIVLGLGGHAGHFGAGAPADAAGSTGRHRIVREVAAVTGACLAVERRKFADVGGFDARNFPIELNDVDLCLRLAARGWRARLDPGVEILHEESASRGGATFRRAHVHAAERACFAARWRHMIRDDPYFHPGLSLYHPVEALGG